MAGPLQQSVSFHTFTPKIIPTLFVCIALLAVAMPTHGALPEDAVYTQCWQSTLADNDVLAVALDGGRIYVSHSSGTLDAVSLDGKMEWSAELGGSITSNVVG